MSSIYKRKNGTYCVRVFYSPKNQCVSKTYRPAKGMSNWAIQKELKRFANSFEELVHSEGYDPTAITDSDKMTVNDFVSRFYFAKIEKRMSPNTVRFYRSVIEQFIVPSFGKARLSEIKKRDLQQFVDCLTENPEVRVDGKGLTLSAPTVKRYATVFRSVINTAYNMEFISDNPFLHGAIEYPEDKRLHRRDVKDTDAYGLSELKDFFEALSEESPLTKILLTTSVVTGVRRGELVALQWSDIDFENNCLYIDKSAYKLKGQKQAVKGPKSQKGYRNEVFGQVYKNYLLLWKKEQDKIRKAAGNSWNEQGFIFTDDHGNMKSIYSITRLCAKFEEKNKLRHMKLHGLRHTYSSVLHSCGVSLDTLKDLMGHNSVKTTQLYTHQLYEEKVIVADKMNDLLIFLTKDKENKNETSDNTTNN